jgi:hypothetical protein
MGKYPNLKYIALVFLIFSAVFISSCKKNDPKVKATISIVGKWTHKTRIDTTYKSGIAIPANYTFNKGEFLQFNEDGTGLDEKGNQFTYRLINNVLTQSYSSTLGASYTTEYIVKEMDNTKIVLVDDNTFSIGQGNAAMKHGFYTSYHLER